MTERNTNNQNQVKSMEKPTTHRKKQFVSNAFKYMIAVSSIAGTLGIWNLLANKDLVNANAQTNNTNGQTTTSIDQVPLPTLVPVIKVDMSNISSGTGLTTAAAPLREVARPTAAPAATSSSALPGISSNNQSNPVVLPPAPVTTTQSSRP